VDNNFPYFLPTPVLEGDLITVGEIAIRMELIPWLYNIFVPNSNVNGHKIPLQWRSKSSKDGHVLIAGTKMCDGTIWKSLEGKKTGLYISRNLYEEQ